MPRIAALAFSPAMESTGIVSLTLAKSEKSFEDRGGDAASIHNSN
jgi:hypothetical protein